MAVPQINDYELQRTLRLEENRKRMEEMGLMRQKTILESFAPSRNRPVANTKAGATKPPKQPRLCRPRFREEPRRSKRILGEKIDYCEIGDNDQPTVRSSTEHGHSHDTCGEYHELLDLMDRGRNSEEAATEENAEAQQEMQEKLQQMRCSSQGRGSVYDSAVGITCHFCRQKKLCGEQDCPRCQHRDSSKECIGKTECSKCHSAFGKFCRACLLIRYGQTLEEATQEMEAGTWLCPHCYEEDHPEEGWICNSSICMKRRGLKPTGIAIYTAMDQGYKSVAHLLQVELQRNGGVGKLRAAAQRGPREEAGTTPAADQDAGGVAAAEPQAAGVAAEGAAAEAAEAVAEPERVVAVREPAATEKGRRGRGRPRKVILTNAMVVVPEMAEEGEEEEEAVATQVVGGAGRGAGKRSSQEALEGGEAQQEQGPRRSLRSRTKA